jgi:hypothetical protein
MLEDAVHIPANTRSPAFDRERARAAGERIRELRKGVTLGGADDQGVDRRRPSVSRFVLDNTVTMAWCFADEATPFTENLLNRLSSLTDSAIVPALWL